MKILLWFAVVVAVSTAVAWLVGSCIRFGSTLRDDDPLLNGGDKL